MPAFVVVLIDKVTDPAEIKEYRRLGSPSLQNRDVKMRVRPGPLEVLEGPPTDGIVILEFPTIAEAKDWYHSPAYQEALKHRFAGASCRAWVVEGV